MEETAGDLSSWKLFHVINSRGVVICGNELWIEPTMEDTMGIFFALLLYQSKNYRK